MVHLDKILVGSLLVVWSGHVHAFSPATRSFGAKLATTTKPSFHRHYSAVFEDAAVAEQDKTAAVFQEDTNILGGPIPYEDLTIGVMKETFNGENRVSQTPDSVASLIKAGFNVVVQAGGKDVQKD